MVTTTWELHYAAPRSSTDQDKKVEGLEAIKKHYTVLRMDWTLDGGGLHIMFADPEVMFDVIMLLGKPDSLTCQFSEVTYDGTCHGKLVLDDEEDESSEISFPTGDRSE